MFDSPAFPGLTIVSDETKSSISYVKNIAKCLQNAVALNEPKRSFSSVRSAANLGQGASAPTPAKPQEPGFHPEELHLNVTASTAVVLAALKEV